MSAMSVTDDTGTAGTPSESSSIGGGLLVSGPGDSGVHTRRSGLSRSSSYSDERLRGRQGEGASSASVPKGTVASDVPLSLDRLERVMGGKWRLRPPESVAFEIRTSTYERVRRAHRPAEEPIRRVGVAIQVRARRLEPGWQPFPSLPGWGGVVFNPMLSLTSTIRDRRSPCKT
eukprot:6186937-Pleurochrysis_carterae.AAC.1